MSVEVKVDVSRMDAYFRMLLRTTPTTIDQIIRAEAGSILKECVLRTKVAKAGDINTRAQSEGNRAVRFRLYKETRTVSRGTMYRNSGRFKNTQNAGRVWFRVARGAGAKFLLLYGAAGAAIWGKGRPRQLRGRGGIGISASRSDYPSQKLMQRADYFKYQAQAEAKARTVKGKQSAGLARQSWVQSADEAGIRLEDVRGGRDASAAIAKARRAIASTGKRYLNGRAAWIGAGFRRAVRIANTYPLKRAAGMSRVLASVIAGRIAFAERVFRRGLLTNARDVARNFPNLRVTVT